MNAALSPGGLKNGKMKGMDWTKFDLAKTDPRFLHGSEPVFIEEPRVPVRAIVENLGKRTPEQIAEAYQIDLELVLGTKRFIESQSVASPV